MGPPNILEVFHPAFKVAVLHKVLGNFHSLMVRDLFPTEAHRLRKQEICPEKGGDYIIVLKSDLSTNLLLR